MISDVDEVILIKDKLKEKLENYEWLRGIGITTNNNGKFIIKVIVSQINGEILQKVPINFEGITVILKEFTKEPYQGE